MPDTLPDLQPAALPTNPFFAAVVRDVHQKLKETEQRRLRNKQAFTIPETAKLTGLSAPEVKQLIDDQEINANEIRDGWWLLPAEEVRRIVRRLAPEHNCQAGFDYLAAIGVNIDE